ncbi:MAG: tetratricopeptide repeat protein [Candidatus Eiseniibacteriota bacterium]|nr:MAG: tetratricopeptide repeat protein [Candidatus Eisenbacteria bacterium]
MRAWVSIAFILATVSLSASLAVSQTTESLTSTVPQSTESLAEVYETAMGHVEKGEHQEALPLLRMVVADSADFAAAHYNLGFVYERLGTLDSAGLAYRSALSLDSTLVMAHYGLGTLSLRTGNREVAILHLRKATGYDPSFADAYLNLGNALAATEDLDGAIVSLRKAIDLRNDYADAYYQLGATMYRKAGSASEYGEVIDVYKKAVELDPQHVNASVAHFYLAKMYLDTQQYAEAVASADNAVKVKPDLAQALFIKGKALEGLDNTPEAIEAYKKAIEKKTPYGSAHYALARLYQKSEQYELALQEYKAAADDETFSGADNALKAASSIESYLKKKAASGG